MENVSLYIDIESCMGQNDDDAETASMSSYYNISSTDSSNSISSQGGYGAPYDLFSLLNEIDYDENTASSTYALLLHYDTNYTVKQLKQICDYYGIKMAKRTGKAELLTLIVTYETDETNYGKVNIRKQMWYYMEKLKQDKFMKKFIIW